MAAIILVPALACWAVLAMGSARKALLWVYLPALLLLPQYYVLRLPHLPPISFADAAILPLGIALVFKGTRHWRWSWMDLFVLLFAVCAGFSEAFSSELANGDWTQLFSPNLAVSQRLSTNIADGGLMFVAGVLTMVLPYMAGKLLIEQEDSAMRKQLVARIVALLAVVAALSTYDFLTGRSLWQRLATPFLGANQNEVWEPQMRWGFGRIAGPYGHAILAGMIFLIGLVYCLWLRSADPNWGSRRLIHGLPFTVRGLSLAAIVAGLLMTQSRGPWIGVGLALIFVLLTRYLPAAKAAIVFAVFCAVFAAGALYFINQYTEKAISQASTEEQRNAIYRRQLLTNYTPLVMERKAFGWGITTLPAVNGQVSIDNQYLMLAVTEGFTGLAVFLAIVTGSALKLLRMISQPIPSEDRMLALAHLAVLIGLMTTLTTVYMGEQVVMLFFLFTGWVQAMHPAVERVPVVDPLVAQVGFRRVLV
jgi:O-antigen ligase/polysaccharide polymerase Wzy-like membrane protein